MQPLYPVGSLETPTFVEPSHGLNFASPALATPDGDVFGEDTNTLMNLVSDTSGSRHAAGSGAAKVRSVEIERVPFYYV